MTRDELVAAGVSDVDAVLAAMPPVSAWLAAAGLPVALAQAVLPWLPWMVATALLGAGAEAAAESGLVTPRELVAGGLAALLAPQA